jgi:type IV pilus assembly protein PilY1
MMGILMKLTLPLLAMLLAPLAAQAGPTQISQVPILNISGSGLVKPNLMLLYDNSGSMTSTFTPDYVDDGTSCRRSVPMSAGTRGCAVGHPPFNSPDFNKQYYNPEIHYETPKKADSSTYPSMTAANSGNWTAVPTDAFAINTKDLRGNNTSSSNLVAGFPDLMWCATSSDSDAACKKNTATYSYPNPSYQVDRAFNTNAYYYTINTAEYCSDANLTVCETVAVGAPAPAGKPFPAKVRWCNSTALTNCQARYVGTYKYPRFSNPNSGLIASYGTITIGSSNTANGLEITSVSVTEGAGSVVITNGTVTAAAGTNTGAKQAALANALAASVIAKNGLTNQYTACVRTSSGGGVPNCSTLGITLGADNIVAVVPIVCSSAGTKALGPCLVLTDTSRSGWAINPVAPSKVVNVPSNATALLTIGGTSHRDNVPKLSGMSLGAQTLIGGAGLNLPKNASSSTIANTIRAAIGTQGTLTAYIGNDPAGGPVCAGKSSSTICLVDTVATGGATISMGSLTNNLMSTNKGTLVFTTVAATARVAAVNDAIPVTSAPLSSGSAVFVRVDIIPARNSYPRALTRADCASATVCTYAEEMTNFANWYAYYKTRNQMMKTSVGRAFDPVTASFKVGLVSLSTAAAEGAMTPPKIFGGADRTDWYNRLYAMNGNSGTPLRQALHAVGKMYANRAPYTTAAGNEVVKLPCEQNFTFMTTDGYWNGGAAADVTSSDEVESTNRFCTLANGCVDPADQAGNSLADVALYWYNGGFNEYTANTNSLRPTLETWSKPGLVSGKAGDNKRLHMTTYTLGLGVDGLMTYDAKYNSNPAPGTDFYKLINRVTSGCPWNGGGAYVWPDPATGDSSGTVYQSRVDDLWHAAVNGHGKYFSAAYPSQVVDGLRDALASITSTVGAAAAAATSTPNISLQDNDIFSDTFTTVKWYGELANKKINTVTGDVMPTAEWISSDTVGRKVGPAADTRVIKMMGGAGVMKDFTYSAMSPLERSWFDNKCALLPQCPSLSAENKAILDSGTNVVNWLRGQQQYANDEIMRSYALTDHTPALLSGPIPIVLGDIASSKPAYVRDPRKQYSITGYNTFKVANQNRRAVVYAAANDGMLHAFDAKTGEELWAYAPRITMKKLFLQTSNRYYENHQYTTDGSPEIADIQIGGAWKTVLVAGLNGGGRGYYALDVTDPLNPLPLWEVCADTTICGNAAWQSDLGLSFGNPQFGMYNNEWVVLLTSGYNNIPDGVGGGNGGGHLFVVNAATGAIKHDIQTGVGSLGTPSGFAKITAITPNPATDPVITHVYGGDNLGNMWRFDLTGTTITKTLMGAAGADQPITTRPDVTTCKVSTVSGGNVTVEAKKVVVYGTGRLLDIGDVADEKIQSLYMVKDSASTVTPWRSGMVQQTLSLIGGSSGQNFKITRNPVDLSSASVNGWYVDLNLNKGERINLDPAVVAGSVIVVANMPKSTSTDCSVGGSSNSYQLDVCNGSYLDNGSVERIGTDVVVGKTLSATSAAVGFIVIRLPNGILKMITTLGSGEMVPKEVPRNSDNTSTMSGWRQLK